MEVSSADFVPLDTGVEVGRGVDSPSSLDVGSISRRKAPTLNKLNKKARKALLRKAVAAAVSKAGESKHNILNIQQSKLLVKKDRRIIKKELKRIKKERGNDENATGSSEHFTEEELQLLFPPKPKKNKDKYDPEKRKLMKAKRISYSGRPFTGSNNVSVQAQSKKRKLSDASQHHRDKKKPTTTEKGVAVTQEGDSSEPNSLSSKQRKENWKSESKKQKAQRKQEKKIKLQAEKELAMKIAPERVVAAEKRAQEIRDALSTEKANSRIQRKALVVKHNKEKADAVKNELPDKEIRQISLQHRIERRRLRKEIKKRRIAGNLVISKKVPDEIVKTAIKATTTTGQAAQKKAGITPK